MNKPTAPLASTIIGKRSVRRFDGQQPTDHIITAPVCAASMPEGFKHDGHAILKLNYTLADLTPGRLCVVRVAGCGRLVVRVHLEEARTFRLEHLDVSREPFYFDASDVIVEALVMRIDVAAYDFAAEQREAQRARRGATVERQLRRLRKQLFKTPATNRAERRRIGREISRLESLD